jgi:hypothetical protein
MPIPVKQYTSARELLADAARLRAQTYARRPLPVRPSPPPTPPRPEPEPVRYQPTPEQAEQLAQARVGLLTHVRCKEIIAQVAAEHTAALLADATLSRRRKKLTEITPELITEGNKALSVMLARRAAIVAIWHEFGATRDNILAQQLDEELVALWEREDREARGPRPLVRQFISLSAIGRIFNQDHTTVMHALDAAGCLEGAVARRTLRRRRARAAAAAAKKAKMKGRK